VGRGLPAGTADGRETQVGGADGSPPRHPEAVGFAGHYDFDIDVLAAYRPQGKGRVERQVLIVRDHVLSGRAFSSLEEMDAAFTAWVPLRRAQIHKTHPEVIAELAARGRHATGAVTHAVPRAATGSPRLPSRGPYALLRGPWKDFLNTDPAKGKITPSILPFNVAGCSRSS
jgi:hypothetical protein